MTAPIPPRTFHHQALLRHHVQPRADMDAATREELYGEFSDHGRYPKRWSDRAIRVVVLLASAAVALTLGKALALAAWAAVNTGALQ